MNRNTKLLVSAMTGSAAKVLWAFFFARQALYIDEVQSWTGLKRETAYQALEQLRGFELLEPTTGAHGKKQWHLASETLPVLEEIASLSGGAPKLQESEKRTSELPTTTTESINSIDSLTVVVGGQESEKRTSGQQANWEAARRAGIGEPKRTEIAMLPHVTPELITDHVRSLKRGERIGLAILRIAGDEVPACRTQADEQAGSKYINGEFSDFIEH